LGNMAILFTGAILKALAEKSKRLEKLDRLAR
jgi:hypothetical protein